MTAGADAEGSGEIVALKRWAGDHQGSGLYVRPDVPIDLSPHARHGMDGNSSHSIDRLTAVAAFASLAAGALRTTTQRTTPSSFSRSPYVHRHIVQPFDEDEPVMAAARTLVLALCLALLAGCATPKNPIALQPAQIGPGLGRVGLVFNAPPKPGMHFEGVNGLIGMLVVETMHAPLAAHAQTLPTEPWMQLRADLMQLLRKRGVDVVVIEGVNIPALPSAPNDVDSAGKDFRPLRAQFNVDRVLVINVGRLGFTRKYSGQIPVTDPQAQIGAAGYMVNLQTNRLDWHESIGPQRAAGGPWDEPPHYPRLSKAYAEVVEMAKDQLRKPFAQP